SPPFATTRDIQINQKGRCPCGERGRTASACAAIASHRRAACPAGSAVRHRPLARAPAASRECATQIKHRGAVLKNKLLRNAQGQIRNGWWMLLFAVLFVASQVLFRPVSHGLRHLGLDKEALAPLPFIFLVAITSICLR